MKKISKKSWVIIVAVYLLVAAIIIMIVLKNNSKSDKTTCAQIVTKIKNKTTNEVKDNPNTCIPDGWEKHNGASTATNSNSEDESAESDYTKVVIDPVSNITANQEAQTVASADRLVSCGYTRQTTEGPYYISGSKKIVNGNLNYDSLAGTPLKIAGYVYGSEDNSKPIAGPNNSKYDTRIKRYICKKTFDFNGNLVFSKFYKI